MVGPSSSHTAGVLRIGRFGRSLIGGDPEKIDLYFYGGALAQTYKGHMSDSAIVAGLLGYLEDSLEVKTALEEAKRRNIRVVCHSEYSSKRDPNTVDMRLLSKGRTFKVVGITMGGGEILITEIEDFPVSLRGNEDGVMLIADRSFRIEELEPILGAVHARSIPSKNGASVLHIFVLDAVPIQEAIDKLANVQGVSAVFGLESVLNYKLMDANPLFGSIAEMLRLAEQGGNSIVQLAVAYERRRSGQTEEQVRARVSEIWKTMKDSVKRGLEGENKMLAGFVSRDSAARMMRAVDGSRTLSGPILGKAIARAIAAMETNACAECIVAAPTAGSCGVVPGAIITAIENLGLSDGEAIEALLVAALMGTLIAMRASLSGSVGGCQAEIGVASAMGGAALVQLAGGTPRQIAQATAFALKNLLGLICDPVAGPVEIPCIKRNSIGVANAFVAADMALAGLESGIPPDEVIGALANTQELLPPELKGTMGGGLSSTPTAIRLKKEWALRTSEQ